MVLSDVREHEERTPKDGIVEKKVRETRRSLSERRVCIWVGQQKSSLIVKMMSGILGGPVAG